MIPTAHSQPPRTTDTLVSSASFYTGRHAVYSSRHSGVPEGHGSNSFLRVPSLMGFPHVAQGEAALHSDSVSGSIYISAALVLSTSPISAFRVNDSGTLTDEQDKLKENNFAVVWNQKLASNVFEHLV